MIHAVSDTNAQDFLSVPDLLEHSQPRPMVPWLWYLLGIILLTSMVGAYWGSNNELASFVLNLLTFLVMVGSLAGLMLIYRRTARLFRREHQQVEAVGELIQLRHWSQAAGLLQQLMSSPMRAAPMRIQALIFLASVQARYHRFAQAIEIHEYLLENVQLDPMTDHGIRLARVIALLHEDRLTDADGALAELRRTDRQRESGGLALVEMYRDIKTGHPSEAIAIFQQRRSAIRQQLGHRLGDAFVLLACAHDMMQQRELAQHAYTQATLLVPAVELHRRYPETAGLAGTYTAADWPLEVSP